jgi:uncharacterized protein (TIGR02145 family)
MPNNNIYTYRTPKSGHEETGFFSTKGRITRKVFFLRLLFSIGLYVLSTLFYVNGVYGEYETRSFIFFETIHIYLLPIFLLAFILIQGAKRSHDVNRSGWFALAPFYNLYLFLLPGTKGHNKYGIDPSPVRNIQYFDEMPDSIDDSDSQQKSADKRTGLEKWREHLSRVRNDNAGKTHQEILDIARNTYPSRSSNKTNKNEAPISMSNYRLIFFLLLIAGAVFLYTTNKPKQTDLQTEVATEDSLVIDSLAIDSYSFPPTEQERNANITWETATKGYFIDQRDNNKYAVVKVGNQVWMTDNLRYNSSESVSFKCDPSNDNRGRLYNWDDAKESVPNYWRLPSKSDYNKLLLKLSDSYLWDPSYFNAYSSGSAFLETSKCDSPYPQWDDYLCYWTSTPYGNEVAWALIHYDSGLKLSWSDSYRKGRYEFGGYYGVRCILNE